MRANHACLQQCRGIQISRGSVRANMLIHFWLRCGGLVRFIVAVAAIAHQIDHHIALKFLPIVKRDLRAKNHRFWVVAIDVQYRRVDHFCDIGAIKGAACVFHLAGGKADLIIDYHMDRSADGIAACLRHIEQLRHHALASKRGVAVDQNRYHDGAFGITPTNLARTYGSGDHRIDDFQMRRVKAQRQMHRTACSFNVGRKAQVILHVTRMSGVITIVMLTFKRVKQRFWRLADGIDQHIQAPAMRHADHNIFHARSTRALHQLIHKRNHAVAAFQRKALLADIFGV